MTNQSYLTMEDLIKDLCDGDKNLKSRELVSVQAVQEWYEQHESQE